MNNKKHLACLLAGALLMSYVPVPEQQIEEDQRIAVVTESAAEEDIHSDAIQQDKPPERPRLPKPQIPPKRRRPTCGGCKEFKLDIPEKLRRQKGSAQSRKAHLKNQVRQYNQDNIVSQNRHYNRNK